jgi:hypothetical protein
MNIAKALLNDSAKSYLAISLQPPQFLWDFDLNPDPATLYKALHILCNVRNCSIALRRCSHRVA